MFKKIITIAALAAFAFTTYAFAQQNWNSYAASKANTATINDPEAEKIISSQVKAMEQAWNEKSGAGFAQSFADNAYFVYNVEGRFVNGKAVAAESMGKALNSIYKNSQMDFTIEKIHFLRPDIAVVNIGLLSHVKENPEIAVKGQMMWVLSKNNGKWEIETLFYEFDKRWVDLMREIREGTYKGPGSAGAVSSGPGNYR